MSQLAALVAHDGEVVALIASETIIFYALLSKCGRPVVMFSCGKVGHGDLQRLFRRNDGAVVHPACKLVVIEVVGLQCYDRCFLALF